MEGADRLRERTRDARAGRAFGRPAGGSRSGAGLSAAAVSPGERMAAASGVALALLMLLDWFGGRNAWQLGFVDVLLLAIAGFAVGAAAVRATGGGGSARGGAPGLALTVAGAVGVGVMLTLVIESTGGTVPLVLSLVATIGILGGGVLVLRDGGGSEVSSARPRQRPVPSTRARTDL